LASVLLGLAVRNISSTFRPYWYPHGPVSPSLTPLRLDRQFRTPDSAKLGSASL